ncbi:MAG TPA: RHS repeat-associated core domain-containing protein [Rhodocyclaceae bacterium]|nr:RHS repeat-associated core domain-containing protein [Rhodocyclaceae bacterium]HNB79642.1 RHS repeat-associated core domain-containing protein [Rhodocyclaceae bacterium]HNC67883.1 RHS repeat-associated core domain-containing protein [Thauera aminoaromatica]HNG81362.1 RHS repeat-associated core domain-containing protein [Burkholderiaceae bacterium]HNH64194.1 RHS repeat-associated core domain-containing protein [Thauera aminoaromatica]
MFICTALWSPPRWTLDRCSGNIHIGYAGLNGNRYGGEKAEGTIVKNGCGNQFELGRFCSGEKSWSVPVYRAGLPRFTAVYRVPVYRSYLYDNLDRLVGESAIGRSYAYDLSGNRTSLGIGGTNYAYTYKSTAPLSNRLLAAQGPLPARNYSFNETGAITGDGQKTYAYNLRGRLATLTTAAGVSTYEHNGLGQRTAKTVLGTTTRYAYDEQGHLLGEYAASGTPIREYVWLGDTPVLMLAHTANQPPTVYLIHADQIDTPRMVQDAQYNNRWAWDADGFGQLPPNENPAGLGGFVFNLRMPGQYFDAESGLFYNHFRDYDPGTGRYVESDPIGLAGGINTYSYVRGNPLSNVDPEGKNTVALGAGAGGAIAGPPGAVVGAVLGFITGVVIYEVCKSNSTEKKCKLHSQNRIGLPPGKIRCNYICKLDSGGSGFVTRIQTGDSCPSETDWVEGDQGF